MNQSQRTNKRQTKNRTRNSQVQTLESRRLLAGDLEIESSSHDHDDHPHLGEYWLPPARQIVDAPPIESFVELTSAEKDADGLAATSPGMVEKYARANMDLFATSTNEELDFRVGSSHVDQSSGATYVYLQQTFQGKDVINAVANLAVSATGDLISAYSSFVDPILEKVSNLTSTSVVDALISLSDHLGLADLGTDDVSMPSSIASAGETLIAGKLSSQPIPYESVYVPSSEGTIASAWRLNVQLDDGSGWYDSIVSKVDSDVDFVSDWVTHASYRVYASPSESPYDGPRSIEVNPHDSTASPLGWHDNDGVPGADSRLTIGNNVNAYTDADANNLPDPGSQPNGGPSLSFNYPSNVNLDPTTYSDASVTNLFYTTNFIADTLEHYGFDEASGNFQTTNYSGLGLGGDPVLAEAQDGGGINNANFATPPDGNSPRMQMFLWDNTTVRRDGSFDNGIIYHEFGHGVSNRLTGGASNAGALNNTQSRGMGEGWSDYIALFMTQTASDQANDGRGIGTYALGEPSTGPGIRSQPYSYDMAVNDHTFANIIGLTSEHAIGEIWATTLWDLNWALINGSSLDRDLPLPGLGFDSDLNNGTGGNNVAMKLVIEAMKLQPSNPTFLQARDAILAADVALNGGMYQGTIWKVFARRGMGLSASAPGGSGSTNVVEAFDSPIIGNLDFDRVKPIGSLVSRQVGELVPLPAGGSTELTFFAERDSKVSFHAEPTSSVATLSISVRRASGAILVPTITAAGPGEAVDVIGQRIGGGGNYIVTISTNTATGVDFEAARNAVLESQVGDSVTTNRVDLDPAFIALGGGITSVIGSSNSGYTQTQYNAPGRFFDISTTGTALGLTDDGEALITTTVGNALFPAGPTTVGNNGAIISAPSIVNVPITNGSLATFDQNILAPFWDDIDSDTGDVYWQERNIGGIPTLIVQWDNRPHFSNTGSATFQLQLFQSGPILSRFAYQDVDFGNSGFDFGASATIGVRDSLGSFAEVSFNEPGAVANGQVIDISVTNDVDYYTFTGQAGQVVDVILDRLNGTQIQTPTLRLLDPTSSSLIGLGRDKPLAGRTTVSNYDQGILSATLPADGTYQIRLLGRGIYDYTLSVTKNAAFDTENTIGTLAPFRRIPLGTAAMGFMNSGDVRDMVDFRLVAGQSVRIIGVTPFRHSQTDPRNTLEMRINVQAPNLSTVAFDQTRNPNGVYVVNYTATQTGNHRLDMRRLSGSGEYFVRVIDLGSNANLNDASLTEASADASSDVDISPPTSDDLKFDVNGDGNVTALDALIVINSMAFRQPNLNSVDGETQQLIQPLGDVSGDNSVSALDALMIINWLGRNDGPPPIIAPIEKLTDELDAEWLEPLANDLAFLV